MMKLTKVLPLAALALQGSHALRGRPDQLFHPERRELLQDIVTFDNYSLLINGERVMIYSGEFHPFRLPVPSLWLDVFEKIKSLGLNCVSVYLHWGALEGKAGDFNAEGPLVIEPFFQAAQEAGLYIIARPGPYINAEATGGGFPGWLQRIEGQLRTNATDYLSATDNYMAKVGALIAKYQITNGGPIILVQAENEYTIAVSGVDFPNGYYMQYIEDQLHNAGIIVPLINNDASPNGYNAPSTSPGAVDIYGHDGYPLGFDCANPESWPAGKLPTYYRETHLEQSPNTPYLIPEFQGGSFDPPGGVGFEKCAALLNMEFERVFYKNNYAAGVTILNLYMIYGGTNWGNIGHPAGYTSYDYGSVISEDRAVDREKYSELKLQANFIKVSPGYLVASAANSSSTGVYNTNSDIVTTPVVGANGSFFVVRHSDYTSEDSSNYTLTLPTSQGTISVPQLGGSLTLNGRDSKVHVTDYPVGDSTLLYSTAEIFTWQAYDSKTVLVVYGGPDELHELAVLGVANATLVEGDGVTIRQTNSSVVAQWQTSTDRRIVRVGDLYIYILDRNSAYNYWVTETTDGAVIVNGPYLVRSASVDGDTLSLKADFNASTSIEILGAPSGITTLQVNNGTLGDTTSCLAGCTGTVIQVDYSPPDFNIPDLSSASWYYIDSLPEISTGYDDSAWPDANHTNTTNPIGSPLLTPVSLYGSDYGFHTGSLLFRGHFTAAGNESTITLRTQGGQAYGFSAWLNGTFIGSWAGTAPAEDQNSTFTLPNLTSGKSYVFTILIDNMGLDENYDVGGDVQKNPRGILDYDFASAITWKVTGNLGGEDYADRARGPLNEGGLFAERQGYHQPRPPVGGAEWSSGGAGPYGGISSAGVAYYTTNFTLSLPSDTWDVPLSLVFSNDTSAAAGAPYRALVFVNGYQLGRYTSNVGPQTAFPVPEGVLDYSGENWLGIALWALGSDGAVVPGLNWTVSSTPVLTGRQTPVLVEQPAWSERPGAY